MSASADAPGEQHGAGDRAAAVGHGGHLGVAPTGPHDLALAALTTELHAGLVNEGEPVQSPARELAPRGVEREQSVTSDVGASFNERAALAAAAEAEGLEPDDGEHAEAVVE